LRSIIRPFSTVGWGSGKASGQTGQSWLEVSWMADKINDKPIL